MSNSQEAWLRSTGETWFESCGQILFPIYADNGAVSTGSVAYIVKREDQKWYAAPLLLTLADKNMAYEELKERIKKIKENWTEFDPSGGPMPMPTREVHNV
jgi:hypothetical protein